MKIRSMLTAGLLMLSAGVVADHNSPMGEGWANMPNDVHNTRVETRGDNQAFRDFVKQGNGAATVNRFSDTTAATSQGGRGRGADAGQGGGQSTGKGAGNGNGGSRR